MIRNDGSVFTVHASVLNSAIDHARRSAPNECAGCLGGRDQIVEWARPLQTVMASPNSFVVDPLDFVEAEEESGRRGMRVCGYYHSHPHTSAAPSRRDRMPTSRGGWTGLSARWELIISLQDPHGPIVRAFLARDAAWKAVEVSVIQSPEQRCHHERPVQLSIGAPRG